MNYPKNFNERLDTLRMELCNGLSFQIFLRNSPIKDEVETLEHLLVCFQSYEEIDDYSRREDACPSYITRLFVKLVDGLYHLQYNLQDTMYNPLIRETTIKTWKLAAEYQASRDWDNERRYGGPDA